MVTRNIHKGSYAYPCCSLVEGCLLVPGPGKSSQSRLVEGGIKAETAQIFANLVQILQVQQGELAGCWRGTGGVNLNVLP